MENQGINWLSGIYWLKRGQSASIKASEVELFASAMAYPISSMWFAGEHIFSANYLGRA